MIVTSKLIKIIVKKLEQQFNSHKSLEELGEDLWATIAYEISVSWLISWWAFQHDVNFSYFKGEFAIISDVEVKQVFLEDVLPTLEHCNFGLRTDTLNAVENLRIVFKEITGCINTDMSTPRRRVKRKSQSSRVFSPQATTSYSLRKTSQPATTCTPQRNPLLAGHSTSTPLRSQEGPRTRSQLSAVTDELAGAAFDSGVIISSTQICERTDCNISNASSDSSCEEFDNIPLKKRMIQEPDSTALARNKNGERSFFVADSDSSDSELITPEKDPLAFEEEIEEQIPEQPDSTELIAENDFSVTGSDSSDSESTSPDKDPVSIEEQTENEQKSFFVADSDSFDSELITTEIIPQEIEEQMPEQPDSTDLIAENDFNVADSDSSDSEFIISKKIPVAIEEQISGLPDSTELFAENDFNVADSDSSDSELITAKKIPKVIPVAIEERKLEQVNSTEREPELDFYIADSDSSYDDEPAAIKPKIISFEEAMKLIYERRGAAHV